jgi:hypothetical protein
MKKQTLSLLHTLNCAYSKKLCIGIGMLMLSITLNAATIYWTGSANDGLWSTASNWSGNNTPTSTDDVVLDNIAGPSTSYLVTLPNTMVTVQSISINPTTDTIKLLLPITNVLSNTLTITTGGLTIKDKGVFINASGISSGTSMVISDSLRILNGGRFVQNAKGAHTALINVLSVASGTENGIFEFNVPLSSLPLSFSGRTFGSLVLSASAAPLNAINYFVSGSNPTLIRGDLVINAGVTFSLNFNDTIAIKKSLFHYGSIFDLCTTPNKKIKLSVYEHISSSPASEFKCTADSAIIELKGLINQHINIKGPVTGNIILQQNNLAGATLLAPLQLPYKLYLKNGKITTTITNLLTLQTNCNVFVDSTVHTSFINGPLKKQGLNNTQHFLMPVGKGNLHRWVGLKNASGNFTVEFFNGDPHGFGSTLGAGIDHISSMDYWTVNADATPTPSAKVELSFYDVNGSAVTDVAALRAAHFNGSLWEDAGNTFTTGSAGAAGSVVSVQWNSFGTAQPYFTLSSFNNQNPLPVRLLYFKARSNETNIFFEWQLGKNYYPLHFELQGSHDGKVFTTIEQVNANSTIKYQVTLQTEKVLFSYYRLKVNEAAEKYFYSNTIQLSKQHNPLFKLYAVLYGSPVLYCNSNNALQITIQVIDINGKLVATQNTKLAAGISYNQLTVPIAPGKYIVSVFEKQVLLCSFTFIK